MKQTIEEFLKLERLAVVGVSRIGLKFGTRVFRNLRSQDYDVVPVNPKMNTFDDQTVYPNLSAIPEPVQGVVVVIPPKHVGPVLREAAKLGIQHVWLQEGAESPEVIALAEELGLSVVHSGPCVMVEAKRARFAAA